MESPYRSQGQLEAIHEDGEHRSRQVPREVRECPPSSLPEEGKVQNPLQAKGFRQPKPGEWGSVKDTKRLRAAIHNDFVVYQDLLRSHRRHAGVAEPDRAKVHMDKLERVTKALQRHSITEMVGSPAVTRGAEGLALLPWVRRRFTLVSIPASLR